MSPTLIGFIGYLLLVVIVGLVTFRFTHTLADFLIGVTGGQTGRALVMGTIVGSLGIGVGYVGQPHLLTRLMAIRKPGDLRQGTLIAMTGIVVAFWGAVLVGIAGLAHFGAAGLDDPERVMPMIATVFLPAGIAGIVLSLWWRRTTKRGVFAGMVVGAATTVVWHNVAILKDFVCELVPTFVFALIAVFVVSPATKPPERPTD